MVKTKKFVSTNNHYSNLPHEIQQWHECLLFGFLVLGFLQQCGNMQPYTWHILEKSFSAGRQTFFQHVLNLIKPRLQDLWWGYWRTLGGLMTKTASQIFCCQCPCPHGEPQVPPTSAGDQHEQGRDVLVRCQA